jgi:hypothetical protein
LVTPARRAHSVAVTMTGTLIAESLRVGAENAGVVLRTTKVARSPLGDVDAGQPEVWTLLEFEVEDEEVDRLTVVLEAALQAAGGWYCDFRSDDETVVVFAGRSFRYRRGEPVGRATAIEYGRSVGVPEAQLDWPI